MGPGCGSAEGPADCRHRRRRPSEYLKEDIEPLSISVRATAVRRVTISRKPPATRGASRRPAGSVSAKPMRFLGMIILTLSQHMRGQRSEENWPRTSAAHGALCIVLAAAGLFGVTLYAVGRRMREFGIRVAWAPPRAAGQAGDSRGPAAGAGRSGAGCGLALGASIFSAACCTA